MKINHNITAMVANYQLGNNDNTLSKAMERLSSGYKINRASDDAAGLAISEKMRAQIRGLEQATRNSEDGISVVQTAEGALNEVHAMLQRMRELGVQAANDAYDDNDRSAMQNEINQLNEEVQRISDTTDFNGKILLNGDIGRTTYADNKQLRTLSLSDKVVAGTYKLSVNRDARQAVIVGNQMDASQGTEVNGEGVRVISEEGEGNIVINGQTVHIAKGDTAEEAFEKVRKACDNVGANIFAVTDPTDKSGKKSDAGYIPEQFDFDSNLSLVMVSKHYGSSQRLEISCDNEKLQNLFGIDSTFVKGLDAEVTLTSKAPNDAAGFDASATVKADGNKILVTDRDGFEMMFEVEEGAVGSEFDDVHVGSTKLVPDCTSQGTALDSEVTVLDAGTMVLQIGANEGQTMEIAIQAITPKVLGIDMVNVRTAKGGASSLAIVDKAITTVSEIRSKLGAYQNRLEHTVNNLETTDENLTASLSRIMDADMAEEMTNYTQANVLVQSAVSMLSKANARPENVLQLLQQ